MGHLEMVAAIVHQLTRNLKEKDIENTPLEQYFVDHTTGVYPTAASGFPWTAATIQVKGDPIADLTEDLAADATTSQSQHLKNSSGFQPEFALFQDHDGRSRYGRLEYLRFLGSGVLGLYTAVSIPCGYPLP